MSETFDDYGLLDEEENEIRQSQGATYHNDESVCLLLVPHSSGASTSATTTFLCEIASPINAEVEGTDLNLELTGLMVLATNVTKTRPILNGNAVPAFKVGDRIVMVNY